LVTKPPQWHCRSVAVSYTSTRRACRQNLRTFHLLLVYQSVVEPACFLVDPTGLWRDRRRRQLGPRSTEAPSTGYRDSLGRCAPLAPVVGGHPAARAVLHARPRCQASKACSEKERTTPTCHTPGSGGCTRTHASTPPSPPRAYGVREARRAAPISQRLVGSLAGERCVTTVRPWPCTPVSKVRPAPGTPANAVKKAQDG
jgi:hypothetical protein